jgi:hypothetical protein
MADFMEMMMTRGQRKLEAELFRERIETEKEQRAILKSQEARAARMEPHEIAKISAYVDDISQKYPMEYDKMQLDEIKQWFGLMNTAVSKGQVDAANALMGNLAEKYPQFSAVGGVHFEDIPDKDEYQMTPISGEGVFRMNKKTGRMDWNPIPEGMEPSKIKISKNKGMMDAIKSGMGTILKKYSGGADIGIESDEEGNITGIDWTTFLSAKKNAYQAMTDAERTGNEEAIRDLKYFRNYERVFHQLLEELIQEKTLPFRKETQPANGQLPAELVREMMKYPKGKIVTLTDGRKYQITEEGPLLIQ